MYSHNSGAGKSKVKAQADSISGESPLPHRWPSSHGVLTQWKE